MAKKKFTSRLAERLSQIVEVGTDIEARTIYLWNDIEESSIRTAAKSLKYLENISPSEPINIWISTIGGDVYEMFSLYDIMRSCSCDINTFGTGKVMSAGPLLLAAGNLGCRYITENATIMLHEGDPGIEGGSIKQVDAETKHVKTLNKLWCDMMARRTPKTARYWNSIINKDVDVYWTPSQALKNGLIDHIVPESDLTT